MGTSPYSTSNAPQPRTYSPAFEPMHEMLCMHITAKENMYLPKVIALLKSINGARSPDLHVVHLSPPSLPFQDLVIVD